jgi:hypothetical protein
VVEIVDLPCGTLKFVGPFGRHLSSVQFLLTPNRLTLVSPLRRSN